MPNELRNLRVNWISLVKSGANRKGIILKDGEVNFEKELKRIQKDEEKRVVYGVVYAPDEVDTQGDFATREEIEKAAWEFMRDLRLHNVDTGHSFEKVDAYVCESWLIKGKDPLFPDEKEGTWCVGIKIEDEDLWQALKKGEFAGISLAGYAERVRKGEAPSTDAEGFWGAFFSALKKTFAGEKEKNQQKEEKVEKKDINKEIDFEKMAEVVKKAVEGEFKSFAERLEKVEKALAEKGALPVDKKGESEFSGIL